MGTVRFHYDFDEENGGTIISGRKARGKEGMKEGRKEGVKEEDMNKLLV